MAYAEALHGVACFAQDFIVKACVYSPNSRLQWARRHGILPDDPKGGREKDDEDVGEGLDNEGRPRDPDKGDAVIPPPPPPD